MVTERIMIANANLMDTTPMVHQLSATGAADGMAIEAAFMTVNMPPKNSLCFKTTRRTFGRLQPVQAG